MTGQGEEDAAGWSRGREEEEKGRRRGRRREKGRGTSSSSRGDESDGWATRPACSSSSMDKPKYWACSNDARFPTPAHVRMLSVSKMWYSHTLPSRTACVYIPPTHVTSSAWLDQWTAGGVVCECDRSTYSPSNRAGRLLLGPPGW